MSESLASLKEAVIAGQATIAMEIHRQHVGPIDAIFVPIGGGGLISGIGLYAKAVFPDTRIIGVEPALRHHKLSGLKRVTGLPEDHFPEILDRDVIDEFVSVTDDQAFEAGIRIARTDGVLVGPTTGAVLHAASEWGKENAGMAVVISADNAAKYVSAYAEYL